MSQPCHFLRAITSLWFNSLGTNNSPRVYLSLISLAKRTASCFWEEALALPTYLGLTPWLSLGCKPHHMHVRMILKILQWVSGAAEAGKQKLSFPFGGRQTWQHELSCFIKSAALQSSLCTLIYIALNPSLCSCVAQLLSCKQTSCNAFDSVLLFITLSSLGMAVSKFGFTPLFSLQINIVNGGSGPGHKSAVTLLVPSLCYGNSLFLSCFQLSLA